MTLNEKQLTEQAAQLLPVLEEIGQEDYLGMGRLLYQRLQKPQSYISFVGETSSGKSTLANVFLQKPLLPVAASPTTGTVTHIMGLDRDGDEFYAINRDGTQEKLDRESFAVLSRRPDENLLRLQVRAGVDRTSTVGLNLFDTPGFDAIISGHEETLREFLPQSDAIVFVVFYRLGFQQADQELLELVRHATEHDPDIPVVLVVNRCPDGVGADNRKIAEIRRNAADSLGRPFSLLIVGTGDYEAQPEGIVELEGADVVWREIRSIVGSESRQKMVLEKLREAFVRLVDEADGHAERQEIAFTASKEDAEVIEAMLGELERAQGLSLEAVDRCMGRIERLVPRIVDLKGKELAEEIRELIMESEKWLGQEECLAFVQHHALPRGVRNASRGVEEAMVVELERLDREIQDIANTAIRAIESMPTVKSDSTVRFARNLVIELGRRAGGTAVSSVLQGLGGVGGVAAGAGNLVKMLVSRFGKLIGKTFGREIYNSIGRFFTKKMIQRMNVALALAIEAGTFVYDAMTWQAKMTEKIGEVIDTWKKKVSEEVLAEDLPKMRQANVESVESIYTVLAEQTRQQFDESERGRGEEGLRKTKELRARLADFRERLSVEEGASNGA